MIILCIGIWLVNLLEPAIVLDGISNSWHLACSIWDINTDRTILSAMNYYFLGQKAFVL